MVKFRKKTLVEADEIGQWKIVDSSNISNKGLN